MLKIKAGWWPEWAGGEPTTPDPLHDLRTSADRISQAITHLHESNRGSQTINEAVFAVNQAVSAFNEQWQRYQQEVPKYDPARGEYHAQGNIQPTEPGSDIPG